MNKMLMAFITAASLSAHSQEPTSRPATEAEIELVREGMESMLKDSESARFRRVRFGTGENKDVVCGEVNSKNSYGGYAGFTAFIANHITGEATKSGKDIIFVISIDDRYRVAERMCAEKGL